MHLTKAAENAVSRQPITRGWRVGERLNDNGAATHKAPRPRWDYLDHGVVVDSVNLRVFV